MVVFCAPAQFEAWEGKPVGILSCLMLESSVGILTHNSPISQVLKKTLITRLMCCTVEVGAHLKAFDNMGVFQNLVTKLATHLQSCEMSRI